MTDAPSCGYEPASGLFFERPRIGGDATPWVLIHGGGATGACFRTTPDGRPGWADRLEERGVPVWVTDWPGTGRSGGRDPLHVRYEHLVAGYVTFLREVVGRPCVLLCHSMGGAVTWRVAELARDLVSGVIAVAAAYPGNIQDPPEAVTNDGSVVRVRFAASGVEFAVDGDALHHYSDAYLLDQGIATSTRFPRAALDAFRASLVGIPPGLLLQRLGLLGGLPDVEDPAVLAGLPVLTVHGTEDPAHTDAIERRTVDLLRGWGAEVTQLALGEHGVQGNGHFLFAEDNSDEVLDLILALARPAA